MKRTKADLENLVNLINETAGTPMTPYSEVNGKWKPNANNYHLDGAYGGWKLIQMSSKEGCTGVREVLCTGFTTKSKLYEAMHSFLRGLKR